MMTFLAALKTWLNLDFYEVLLLGMLTFLGWVLWKAHRNADNDFVLTDILSEDQPDPITGKHRASLRKHFALGTWFIHTWWTLRVAVFYPAESAAAFNNIVFYGVLWAGLYLLGPVSGAIAVAVVEKFTGAKVIQPPSEPSTTTTTTTTTKD